MAGLTCILSDRNMARSHVGGCSEQPSCFVYHTEPVWCVAFLGVWEWRASRNHRLLPRRSVMLSERIQIANTREHISWASRFALFWFALSLVIFGGAYAVAEIGEMPEASRTLMFVMLGTILVINAVWQAAGLALARIENSILPRRNRGDRP